MFLSNRDLVEIVDWRRKLHSRPEISGEESETAEKSRNSCRGPRPTGSFPASAEPASRSSMMAQRQGRR